MSESNNEHQISRQLPRYGTMCHTGTRILQVELRFSDAFVRSLRKVILSLYTDFQESVRRKSRSSTHIPICINTILSGGFLRSSCRLCAARWQPWPSGSALSRHGSAELKRRPQRFSTPSAAANHAAAGC